MWYFTKLFKEYLHYKVTTILSVIVSPIRNHPYVLKKLSPRVITKIEQAEKVVKRSNRIWFLVTNTSRMFFSLVMILGATSYLRIGGLFPGSVDYHKTFAFFIIFIALLVVMPETTGNSILNAILGAGRFTRAILLASIWTTWVVTFDQLKTNPSQSVFLLCVDLVLAFAALVFLYKKGKKRMDDEKNTSRLIDNAIDQVKDEGLDTYLDKINKRRIMEYAVERSKTNFVSFLKLSSKLVFMSVLILTLLSSLGIISTSTLLNLVYHYDIKEIMPQSYIMSGSARGKQIDQKVATESLSRITSSKSYADLFLLIDDGADVNVKVNYSVPGTTPLMIQAAYNTDPEVIRFLIKHGAMVNAADEIGNTPLMWAVMAGNRNLEILRVLIENGADVNIANADGTTPLIQAAKSDVLPEDIQVFFNSQNNPEVIRRLITRGVMIYTVDELGNATFNWNVSASNRNPKFLANMINNGAKVSAANMDVTNLFMADAKPSVHPEVVQILLDNGADVAIVNKEGKRAIDYALENSALWSEETYDLLIEKTLSKTK